MKISGDIVALRDNMAVAVPFEMTEERIEKWGAIANEIADLLIERTESPVEARMILEFVARGLEETCGIKSVVTVEKGDPTC